jgi:glucose/arabinose dehydrogenase
VNRYALALPLAALVAAVSPRLEHPRTRRVACVPDNGGITLPAGFCAAIFADQVADVRHLAVAPNGDVFAQVQARSGDGILAMRDTDGDGKADVIRRFGKPGGTGIALWKGWLFADERTRIVRYPLAAGSLEPSGEAEVVVDGLPTGGHAARNFAIDASGNLFVNVGSRTNVCEVSGQSRSDPGQDPCRELETRAGIWRFDANKTDQHFSPDARWATGVRNAVGLTIHPTSGKLYSTQHGRDALFQLFPKYFDAKYGAENPAEELLQIERGDDFGWPYCFYSNVAHELVLAPEYGGDGEKTGRCAEKKAPVAAFPGHWAPNALAFYTGSSFPAKYRGGAFIAFHGSWNRDPEPQAGYNVTFQPMRGGTASGAYEVFADGFAGDRKNPNGATYRPAGLAVMPDGSLLIGADKGGRIWKVVYQGK